MSERIIEKLPSPFSPLSQEELETDWGKELFVGKQFAKELDLYRAITCFKKALFLFPSTDPSALSIRQLEIEYDIFLAYYMGNKFECALSAFEESHLSLVTADFPAYRDLIVTLYDVYRKTNQEEKAARILCLIDSIDKQTSVKLTLEQAIMDADFVSMSALKEAAVNRPSIEDFLDNYCLCAKSVSKAQLLNAVMPGTGYYYVGQKKAAMTSFLVNALFIAASYQLFERGYIPAAIITTSLEMGWYFGGINGAGLAAKEYNDRLYERLGKETMANNRLFPILMIEMAF